MSNNLFVLTGQEDDFNPMGWTGLPEFVQEDNEAPYICIVRFRSEEDLFKFADLLEQPNLKLKTKRNTKSTWYPELGTGERGSNNLLRWVDADE
jgi:hypothetical protein